MRAAFLNRLNRFTLQTSLDGKKVLAYIANPGRLGEILLPGTVLLLGRRPHTRLGWEAVGATWVQRWPGDEPRVVFLNSAKVNDIVERLLQRRAVPELADFRIVRREVRRDASRLDFLLSRGKEQYYLEVKSVTLAEHGLAFFPDAATARGLRHLEELSRIAKSQGAGVLYLAQGKACRFLPDFHEDYEFARAFAAVDRKLDSLAYGMNPVLTPDDRIAFRGLPVELEIPRQLLAAGLEDRGIYMLSLRLERDLRVAVGALGRFELKRGWFLYVGSAKRCLSQRIRRHLRLRKGFHYHIDYLRAACSAVRAFPLRAASLGECDLAREVEKISAASLRGFGSSDCRCPSHLFYFPDPPETLPSFQELLTRLRHNPTVPPGAKRRHNPRLLSPSSR